MLLAWAAVAVAAGAVALLTASPSAGWIRVARILAVLVIASATVGVAEHVYASFDVGSFDRNYADTWDSLPLATRWLLAVSKTVGPAPPLAPGALAHAGICVLLTTVQHPSLTNRRGEQTSASASRSKSV